MSQKIIQVDAFSNKIFGGNPAAVCVLKTIKDNNWMQLVAREMNLSETAFLLKQTDGYSLRWFTPKTEVRLCGHATLASAHVLWTEGYVSSKLPIQFHTLSGVLMAKYHNDWIELDFPANKSQATNVDLETLSTALGTPLKTVLINSLGYLVELESEAKVRQLQPNFSLLKNLTTSNVIVTSVANQNSEYDFISRFFAPGLGIDEDPVTGAAHCCLAPFWHDRLGQEQFLAYQASSRGGVVKVNYAGGDRVYLQGQAVTVMRAELFV